MAKNSTPAPTPDGPQVAAWTPPTGDEEFVFSSVADAPGWVDRNWAGFDRGPALAVPAGDLYGEGPYTTTMAHIGDTVKFMAANGTEPARLIVIPRAAVPEDGTTKPAQVSAASLEDMIKNGVMKASDLGADAKAQLLERSPRLKALIDPA